MGKVFYTERDIEDLVQQGKRSLVMDDNVVLTDLAYEKAKRLGVEILQPNDAPPAAPVRPYINTTSCAQRPSLQKPQSASKIEAIRKKVKTAVRARLGGQVSDELLDRIIDRVAAELGIR